MSEILDIKGYVLGPMDTNCYIVSRKDDESMCDGLKPCIIIDPADNAPFILGKCKEMNLAPQMILLTHGHFDHILAADDIRLETHIPICAGLKEEDLLLDEDLNVSAAFGAPVTLEADRFFRQGETFDFLGLDCVVIYTPGHTEGSVCYYIKSEKIIFAGDTLFQLSIGRTDFPTGDFKKIIDSITRILYALPDDTQVLPGHGPETTIGYEKKNNREVYAYRPDDYE